VLSAALIFNSSNPISGVDAIVNGTYVDEVGVGHCAATPGAPSQHDVTYRIGIAELGRLSIVSGARHTRVFLAASRSSSESSVSMIIVAG
jgi:hypothetical protein